MESYKKQLFLAARMANEALTKLAFAYDQRDVDFFADSMTSAQMAISAVLGIAKELEPDEQKSDH